MRHVLHGFAACAALAVAAAAPARADELKLGDPAPALSILEWVKGEPVDLAAAKGKSVVVVEFWATWCGPCRASIPHVSELQAKYGDKLRVVGVSTEKPEDVKEFVANKESPQFGYSVAVDDMQNTSAAYMGATGVNTIPHAYIVDKAGNLVWHGGPMQMDKVLEKVVAGTWDVAKAKSAEDSRQEMFRQLQAKDLDAAAAAADAILGFMPTDEQAIDIRAQLFHAKSDAEGFRKFMNDLVGKVQDEAATLNDLSWRIATDSDVTYRDAALAVKAAKRAVEVSGGKDASYVDTLARAYFAAGLVDRAVETQKLAIAAIVAKPEDTEKKRYEAEKKQYQAVLAYYESCAAFAKTQKPEPKPDPKKAGGKK
jgi:thiol-disulfide isomerase/thioredoxin